MSVKGVPKLPKPANRDSRWQAKALCGIEYGPSFETYPVAVQQGCCARCDVQAECLAYALATEACIPATSDVLPIYGGMTVQQRIILRRQLKAGAR